jgi:hypothetical protein
MTNNTQEREPLLPCPFCGSKAKEAQPLHKRDSARVICTNGDCLVSVEADELWQDFSHAAAKWNTRAKSAPDGDCATLEEHRTQSFKLGFEACEAVNKPKHADVNMVEKLRGLLSITPDSYKELAHNYSPGLAKCIEGIAAMAAPSVASDKSVVAI